VLRVAIPAAAAALLGASLCTVFALSLSDRVLRIILLAALPCVAVCLAVKKDFGKEKAGDTEQKSSDTELLKIIGIGLFIGAYDGMIGPGAGTFLIMLFTAILRFDLLTASGCAKITNLASGTASAVVWALNGAVIWQIVIPAALCNMLGGLIGSRFAIRGGSRRVRGMIFVVLGLLFLKIIIELFKSRM